MQKTKYLSKNQYCYLNNLDPKYYKTVKQVSKELNWRDKLKKIIKKDSK